MMQVVTMQSEAFNKLVEILENIQRKLNEPINNNPLKEEWLDNEQVCLLLHISKRTLQTYRDNEVLPFSQIGSKIYYKASDIDQFLNQNYRNPEKKS